MSSVLWNGQNIAWMPGMWNHWVVRACTPLEPFKDFDSARLVWKRLNEVFPEMISAVVMMNHIHFILPGHMDSNEVLLKLGGLMSGISKRKKLTKLWQPIPPPSLIPDRMHLRRHIRYVALNPCRKGLCADPLSWYWSTYREVMGASIARANAGSSLARILGELEKNFQVRFHAYVSGDPSVKVTGTVFPVSARPKLWAEESIGEILAASAGALRVFPSDVQKQGPLRSLFIHLAYRHGWRQPRLLSEICGVGLRAVHHTLNQTPPSGLAVADLCLGDRRLRPQEPFRDFPRSGNFSINAKQSS